MILFPRLNIGGLEVVLNGWIPTHAAREEPPGAINRVWVKLGVAGLVLATLTGCSWFRPAQNGEPAPAQAVVLYTAKALVMLNRECAQQAEKLRVRASLDADPSSRIVALKKADGLAAECERATIAGRSALEAAELLLETGTAIADAKIGCAVKHGLDATADVCTAMRVAKAIERCPYYVDSAITFGSPLLAAVGACPIKESK